jgi:hypothetical protein
VRSVFVVIVNILVDQTSQVRFSHRNHAVAEIPSAAFNAPLGNSILPRAFYGGPNRAARRMRMLINKHSVAGWFEYRSSNHIHGLCLNERACLGRTQLDSNNSIHFF